MPSPLPLLIYPSVVTKLFQDKSTFERELLVYQAALPHIPKLVAFNQADYQGLNIWYITAQRIKGRSYLDAELFSPADLAKAIAEFHIASAQAEKCLCHIDNQPQNILLSGSEYFFIDFSDSKVDYPETDVSHLLLFWAEEYNYINFIAKAGEFLNTYQNLNPLSGNRWQSCLKNSIIRFDHRRKHHNKRSHAIDTRENREWLQEVIQ